ncbi:MAG: hypothetical protein M1819_001109 [Sarea resinae]|nr:MAG: hypothetical protein M1819_001109 [Sarea resinae]
MSFSSPVRSLCLLFSTAALIAPSLAVPTSSKCAAGPVCQDFFLSVTATSLIAQFPDSALANLTDSSSVVAAIDTLAAKINSTVHTDVTGTYNISARYCEPNVTIADRKSSIQLLGHGITYTKNYWSALGEPGYEPEQYSWIRHASANGYPTLSIDRVGYGNSSHPDPLIVQSSLQAAVIAKIAEGLKEGQFGLRSFKKVVYVGHSLGSVIGNTLATLFPDSVDGLMLTGYSAVAWYPVVLATLPIPANLWNSSEFGDLSPGYMASSSYANRRDLIFGHDGTFANELRVLEFEEQNTAPLGEIISIIPTVATNFTGPVSVITGYQDTAFCSTLSAEGACGEGDSSLPGQVKILFPNSSNFTYYTPADMGHCLNIHYKAPEVFAYANNWFADHGF